MSKLKQNYRNVLEKTLRAQDPSTPDIIKQVIERLRSSNDRMIESKSSTISPDQAAIFRATFDEAADEFSNDHRNKSSSFKEVFEKSVADFEAKSTFFKGIVIGSAAVIGIIVILNEINLIDIAIKGDIKAKNELYENYTNQRNFARLADEYLTQATDKIKEMQAANPNELSKIAGKNFVSLGKLDEALFKARPKALTGSENIIVKANGKAYKVLMNSNLCSVFAIDKPGQVDPKRHRKNRTCMHFGYWNDAGKDL